MFDEAGREANNLQLTVSRVLHATYNRERQHWLVDGGRFKRLVLHGQTKGY